MSLVVFRSESAERHTHRGVNRGAWNRLIAQAFVILHNGRGCCHSLSWMWRRLMRRTSVRSGRKSVPVQKNQPCLLQIMSVRWNCHRKNTLQGVLITTGINVMRTGFQFMYLACCKHTDTEVCESHEIRSDQIWKHKCFRWTWRC